MARPESLHGFRAPLPSDNQVKRNSDLLLSHESVICGALHHNQDMGNEEYVLTNDGYLAKYHNHGFEGISKLFKMLHASQIRTIELDYSPANKYLRIPSVFFLIVLGSFNFTIPFRYGLDIFWNGREEIVCTNGMIYSPEEYYGGGGGICDDGTGWIWLIFWVSFVASIVMLFNSRKWRLSPGTVVSIQHDEGLIKLADRMNTFLIPGIYFGSSLLYNLFFWMFDYGEGHNWITNLWPLLAVIPVFVFVLFANYGTSSYIPPTPPYPIISMEKFGERLLELLGLSNEDSDGVKRVVPISEKYALELSEIKEQLAIHDEMLSQVGVPYSASFEVPSPWLGVTALRTSTEILLDHRIKQIKPSDQNIRRGLKGHIDALKNIDEDFTNPILLMVETIRANGNAAAHSANTQMTKEDYISCLQKFRKIVDWHFNNLPDSAKVITS